MDSSSRHPRYYDLILAAFVVVLLCSNFIGAGKAAEIELPYFGKVIFGAGILFFPGAIRTSLPEIRENSLTRSPAAVLQSGV